MLFDTIGKAKKKTFIFCNAVKPNLKGAKMIFVGLKMLATLHKMYFFFLFLLLISKHLMTFIGFKKKILISYCPQKRNLSKTNVIFFPKILPNYITKFIYLFINVVFFLSLSGYFDCFFSIYFPLCCMNV